MPTKVGVECDVSDTSGLSKTGMHMEEQGDDMTHLESCSTSLAVTCHEPKWLGTQEEGRGRSQREGRLCCAKECELLYFGT